MTTLRVSGFPASFTPDQVRRVFQPFGVVQAVRPSSDGGTSYDVEMADAEAAQAAQRLLEGFVFGDRPLHLSRAEDTTGYSAVA